MNKALLFVTSACVALFFSCAGADVKTGNAAIDALNAMLARVPIEGYQSGKAASKEQWDKMILAAAPVVKEVLPKVPAGYYLQVTGHTDSEGGVNSPQNINLSTQRALQVWTALRGTHKITDPKLTYKGVAATIKSGKCALDGACQRRVSFIVTK